MAMTARSRNLAALVTAGLAWIAPAHAETTVGVTVQFDRKPREFSDPAGTKYPIELSHSFASGVIIGGSFEPQLKASSDVPTYNLESYVGFRLKLSDAISLGASAGAGERFTDDPHDFPYYVFHIHADIALDERWTLNLVNYRYRNAFNTDHDYNTPEVATGLSLKLDDRSTISAKYYYSWKEGEPEDQGIGIGYRIGF